MNDNNLTMGGIIVSQNELQSAFGANFDALMQQARHLEKTESQSLVWNVYYEDFNRRRIVTYNIFNHADFYEDCYKAAKKYKDDKAAFADAVLRSLRYYYWSKCEWEIVLTAWPPRNDFHDEKIDVADQVEMNWDVFIDYLWKNKGALHAN